MAVNLDPKPGRWILPLVILGMIAFTYFFVRELPEASPDTTLAAPSTTTTTPFTPTTVDEGPDPTTQAYLDEIDAINAELRLLETEMLTVNAGFDAEPREIQYSEAQTRLDALSTAAVALSDRFDALSSPEGLAVNHDLLKTAMDLAEVAAADAIAGLESSDTGERRQSAVQAFSLAVADFDNEVTNAHTTAENPDA